ncbi:prolyl oligopeptidase family serine peptidase [Rubripirellula amarantea]|nr:prolyl oligopeptidase family serine peptidase [Rubripirellula amarantea]
MPGNSRGQQAEAKVEGNVVSEKRNELSLERLYHPTKKVDFAAELPKSHWIGRDQSELLIRYGNRWSRFDLAVEPNAKSRVKPWPVFDRLCDQLATLSEIDREKAEPLIAEAVPSMREATDSIIVRSGNSVITVSAQTPASYLSRDGSTWHDPTLDPTGRKLAYTREGDLFVMDVATNLTRRLTHDASETLLDGILDWTYQEEIYGRGNFRAFWFSPDGHWLAMLRIDIGEVKPYVLAESKHDRNVGPTVRYSKAGDPIPHASLLLWDLRDFASREVPQAKVLVQSTSQDELIISGVWWHDRQNKLVYCISDRQQTYRELKMADPTSHDVVATAKVFLREESPAWVEPPASPAWLPSGGLIWRSELPSGKYRLYSIDPDGRSSYPITPNDMHVMNFAVSSRSSPLRVLFTADRGSSQGHYVYQTTIRDPIVRQDSTAGLDSTAGRGPSSGQGPSSGLGSKVGRAARSSDIPILMTTKPGWHDVDFALDGQWFTDRHSTSSSPPSLSVQSSEADGGLAIAIENQALQTKTPISKPEIFSIKGENGEGLPAMLVMPRVTEAAKTAQRYPVVVEVYGGPGTPTVRDRWRGTTTLYREWLSRQGIATLVVDNRSSAGSSAAASWPVQRELGKYEFADLMTSVDWLKRQPWVDTERIAIRGWSFGGFMTLYAMTHSDAFVAGIAGGAVTDWKEYDSFYTERYMGLPAANANGYEATSVVRRAGQLSGKLLLIHGEIDDNVHPACTLRMADALQQAGKDFEMMIYPGAGHAVTDPNQKWHLAKLTDGFLRRHLQGKTTEN